MKGDTHVWIVEDALRFVRARGTQREKRAFQAWETAYGGGDIHVTPSNKTRIVDIIGQESKYTDYYHDLAIYLESLWGAWQDDITEYDGEIFTSLNHFLAVPWQPTHWSRTNGYHYFWSSRTGNDAKAMTGKVDTKDAEVDNEHSPIVDRCRFGWMRSSQEWSNNWERDIRYTVFVPASVLAFYYYERLIHRYFSYVDVNGDRYDRINGMYLLGPVCHAIADACVPQHVITAMDFRHQEWEAAIQQWTWGYELEDFNLVRNLLDTHMKRCEYSGGLLKGYVAIDYLVSELCGWKTFVTFLQQNNANDIDMIKSTGFWNGYISNVTKLKADARFNYNLAVAATVRIITEACYDVIAAGGGSNPEIKIFGVAGYKLVGGAPARKPEPGAPYHVMSRSELPYVRIESVLGFRPDEWRPSASSLFVARDMLTRWTRERLATEQVKEGLAHFEREQLLAYMRARRAGVSRFEPAKTISFPAQAQGLRNECGLPAVSANLDIQPTFGLATFRLPTDEELSDSDKLAVYLQESDANTINSKLLQVTRCIALSKAFLAEEGSRNRYRKMSEAVAGLERLRDFVLRTRSLPPERWPTSDVALQLVSLEAPRSTENVQMVDTA